MSHSPHHPFVARAQEYFHTHSVPFTLHTHDPVTTSEDAARVRDGYTLSQGSKALIVRVVGSRISRYCQLVIPGDKKFSEKKVCDLCDAQSVSLVSTHELDTLTSGIQPGGVPPLGFLFTIPVIADHGVFSNTEMVFNCGDRRVSVAIPTDAFKRMPIDIQDIT